VTVITAKDQESGGESSLFRCAAPDPSPLTPPVVLVVDDQPSVLGMMVRTLLEVGYTVYLASSGQDALALAEELGGPLDLVVTDIRMEPIGNPELAALLFSEGSPPSFSLSAAMVPPLITMRNSVLFSRSSFPHSG
jgi:CheY-like chemotaxis protein